MENGNQCCCCCIFEFKGASTSKVIGAHNEMMMDDYGGQMIFGDLVGLKLPDIRLTSEEKPRKNLTQETYPDRGSNLGPLSDKHACYHLLHSGGRKSMHPFQPRYHGKSHTNVNFPRASLDVAEALGTSKSVISLL